jgi:AcrR family transcriptional regulator
MREQIILDAAKRLFFERGFDAIGVDELGSAAGVSGPALYRHFKSKDEILATLFDEAMDRLLVLSGPERDDAVEDLRGLAVAHVRFALDDPELLSIYAREDRSLPEAYRRQLHRRQRQFVARWKTTLARLLPESTGDEELTGVAHALIGMILSTANWPAEVRKAPGCHERIVKLIVAAATNLELAPSSDPP